MTSRVSPPSATRRVSSPSGAGAIVPTTPPRSGGASGFSRDGVPFSTAVARNGVPVFSTVDASAIVPSHHPLAVALLAGVAIPPTAMIGLSAPELSASITHYTSARATAGASKISLEDALKIAFEFFRILLNDPRSVAEGTPRFSNLVADCFFHTCDRKHRFDAQDRVANKAMYKSTLKKTLATFMEQFDKNRAIIQASNNRQLEIMKQIQELDATFPPTPMEGQPLMSVEFALSRLIHGCYTMGELVERNTFATKMCLDETKGYGNKAYPDTTSLMFALMAEYFTECRNEHVVSENSLS
jgi:hypothetical protein